MNLRYWGGWFLAIACVCIFLTMGCDNGSLGVKYSTVTGRLVNKDNVNIGVPNATIRMVSKEAVSGGGELEQGYNFRNTVTDENGYFMFERVQPDNVIFEFSAPGYRKVIFPTTSSDSEEDGSSSESLDVESVTISSGDHIDLANILMTKVSQTVPSDINIKVEFIDKNTKQPVPANESFSILFDGISYTKNYAGENQGQSVTWWKNTGVKGIQGSNEITLSITHDTSTPLYYPASATISGMLTDQLVSIEVEPVTYSLTFQLLMDGVQYILDSEKIKPVITFLVEEEDNGAYRCTEVKDVEIENLKQLTTIELNTIKKPQRIRLRMHGYEDQIINLETLSKGTTGNYRIDIDFDKEDYRVNGNEDIFNYPSDGYRVGMKDNAIRHNIQINMFGLNINDRAKVNINLPFDKPVEYSPGSDDDLGWLNTGRVLSAKFKNVPTGYDLTYTINVIPPSDGTASAPYLIASKNPIAVPVVSSTDDEEFAKVIDINISKTEESTVTE